LKYNFLDLQIYYNIAIALMSFCEKEGRRERVKERKTNKKRDACVNNATPHALFTHAS
jgi:hypothetical protein